MALNMLDYSKKICRWPRVDSLKPGSERMRLLFNLAFKLNQAFLRAQDLDDILYAVLVGVTAGEGLGFNRAFLLRLDEDREALVGSFALGPSDSEDASRIWSTIVSNGLTLNQLLEDVRRYVSDRDHPINRLARQIAIPLSWDTHFLVRALRDNRAVLCNADGDVDARVVQELLGRREYAVVPLGSEDQPFGLILADNFVTGSPIGRGDLEAMELFAGFASMAVSKTRICVDLEDKIQRLETLNEELERNRDLLIESERYAAVGRMADQLLHEIRNPVSSIGGMARILKKKLDDPELSHYVDTIIEQSARLEQAVGAVFDFSQPPELHPESVLLPQLIQSTVDLIKKDLETQGIDWYLNMPHQGVPVAADRMQLQQALLNILKNAVEAMPEGGLLIVSTIFGEKDVEVRVADTGTGMAKGHLLRASEPFFTTKLQAMGLGLSLAKRVIELHGGRLVVERNKFGGTNVIMTMPLQSPHGPS